MIVGAGRIGRKDDIVGVAWADVRQHKLSKVRHGGGGRGECRSKTRVGCVHHRVGQDNGTWGCAICAGRLQGNHGEWHGENGWCKGLCHGRDVSQVKRVGSCTEVGWGEGGGQSGSKIRWEFPAAYRPPIGDNHRRGIIGRERVQIGEGHVIRCHHNHRRSDVGRRHEGRRVPDTEIRVGEGVDEGDGAVVEIGRVGGNAPSHRAEVYAAWGQADAADCIVGHDDIGRGGQRSARVCQRRQNGQVGICPDLPEPDPALFIMMLVSFVVEPLQVFETISSSRPLL